MTFGEPTGAMRKSGSSVGGEATSVYEGEKGTRSNHAPSEAESPQAESASCGVHSDSFMGGTNIRGPGLIAARLSSTELCKPGSSATTLAAGGPSGSLKRTQLADAQIPACAEQLNGVTCIPASCREGFDVPSKAGAASVTSAELESSPPGAEQFPSWVTLPSCESLRQCPAMSGWPSHLASVCASDTTLVHCLHQLPPPADPRTVGKVDFEYIPSPLESEFISLVEKEYKDQPSSVCAVQDQFADMFGQWATKAEAAWDNPAMMSVSDASVVAGWSKDNSQPFSLMRTTVTMPDGSTHTSSRKIEPIAGILRHPWASNPKGGTFCKSATSERNLFDHRYVVLDSPRDPTFAMRYPGRKVFMDLGATSFGDRPKDSHDTTIGDARTYEDMFSRMGVEFDMKMGWEVKSFAQQEIFANMAKYDPTLVGRTCHAIRPAAPAPGHLDNALEILAQIWRPGDYFVFKLDIDTPEVEEAFMRVVLDKCPHIVAELIYEEHCNVPELATCCWGTDQSVVGRKYGAALKRFQHLRKLGIRSHFWV
ncbi:hypothetical protein FNF29_02040 [Cafeteria roenbergensis]|uniref:Methyltransferase domain-containing protein n=1 Tax=Cafeteria roenbergensis TaxID=33653 RepID=A0A5A8CQD6_CAFRO|nr:hypothetical protein FNF29_02040 [Cafeteria roenbergensis]|eukprot:KAA0154899.1 hypothetical protein FNF29_02040 [Cafeteria roenbergensis]